MKAVILRFYFTLSLWRADVMTSRGAIKIFEEPNVEGRIPPGLDAACAEFAGGLAEAVGSAR